MASENRRKHTFFVPGKGIDEEVITTDICWYLGNEAIVNLGIYTDPKTGQQQEGYYITAYITPTKEQLAALRSDSAKWREERKKNAKNTDYASSRKSTDSYGYDNYLSNFSDISVPSQDYYGMPEPAQQPYYGMPTPPPQSANDNYPASSSSQQTSYASGYSQPVGQRPAPMRSKSEPVRSGGGNIRDIRLMHPTTGHSRNAAALLDTGCTTDNWVSRQTVRMLGADDLIDSSAPIRTLQAANMGAVQSKGTIKLDWRWLPKGVKVNTATFNVADASHYDVIIGNEYIEEKCLHKWDEDAFSPLTEHDPVISPYESEAMRQAREKQEREKANREAAKERDASRRAGRREKDRHW